MGKMEEYKPEMAMTMIQLCYAGVTLFGRATLVNGLSPRVFILYRQAFATIFIFPFLYFSRRKSEIAISSLDLRSFSLIFLVSLIGITVNQNLYLEGLYLTSSSMGSAVGNIIPAITFLISFLAGYEKLNLRDIRSLAKIAGTILCVVGAVSMTLLRGPKILNSESALPLAKSVLGNILKDQNMWLIGCLFLFSSTLCWSFWLILQVPISTYYPDNLSLSAWMCLFGTIQCAVVTFFLEKDSNAWILHSYSEFATCLYAGIGASALSFTVQAWAISKRGPVFSALFNPLCTVIVTILAALFFQEEIYTGSLIGGLGVIMGLYTVLWGKAKDVMMNQEQIRENDQKSEVKIHIEDSSNKTICNRDLKNPLLSKHNSIEEIQTHQQLN
ncbi:WAT1-related protein At4g30420 [Capsella rubella]|nr:WAT1-related protein At4g30420 [Capsella rubella]